MSRRRYISTQVSLDKAVDELAQKHGDFAALLYMWMIPHALDDATITGDLDELMYQVIPRRRDKSLEDVTKAIEAMQELRLIYWDRDEKIIYFPIESFYKYQTYINKKNRRTADHPWFQRPTPQNAEERRESPGNAVSLSPSLSPSPSLSLSGGDAAPQTTDRQTDHDSDGQVDNMPIICEAYRKIIGTLDGPTQFEMLRHYHEDRGLPIEVMVEAMEEAKARGDFPASYLRVVLNDWANNGVLTLEKSRERRKGRGRSRADPPPRKPLSAYTPEELEELERGEDIGA